MAETKKPQGNNGEGTEEKKVETPAANGAETPAVSAEDFKALQEQIANLQTAVDLSKTTEDTIAELKTAIDDLTENSGGDLSEAAQETIDGLKDQIEKLAKSVGAKVEEASSVKQLFDPKTGQPIAPEYDEDELSDKVPHPSHFNKKANFNRGTKKEPIQVKETVGYLHFHHKKVQYTFWRDLPLTKAQLKTLPKEYVKYLCKALPKKKKED